MEETKGNKQLKDKRNKNEWEIIKQKLKNKEEQRQVNVENNKTIEKEKKQ